MGDGAKSGTGEVGELARLRARVAECRAGGPALGEGELRLLDAVLDRARDAEELSLALRESNARLQAAVESLPFDFFLLDGDGSYALQNSTCRKHWGDLIGTRPGDAAPGPDVRALWEENNRRAFAGEVVKGEVEYIIDGETGWYYNIISPIRDDGRVIGIMGINLDITHEKRLAEELLRSQKLESLSLLAGGIAHDFNNLLMAIQGCISIAASQSSSSKSVPELLEEAERGCMRAKALSHRLLTFSKGGGPLRQLTALGPILEESANLATSGSNCSIDLSIDDGMWCADVDPGQTAQVARNLVLNAVQAMPDGGRIRVSAGNVERAEADSMGLDSGRYLRFSVDDEGEGIADEHLPRLFDPYYTTREEGHGLGLAIVLAVVQKHGGKVRVFRDPAGGARFDVYLPAAAAGKEAAQVDSVPAAEWSGRVLVVDDEEAVRKVLAHMLCELGFTVTTAGSCAAAVARVHESLGQEPFEFVVLDLTLRGSRGGDVCFRKLREVDPGARVIITSGYATDPVLADYRDHGYVAALPKPFSMDTLSLAVRAALRVVGAG